MKQQGNRLSPTKHGNKGNLQKKEIWLCAGLDNMAMYLPIWDESTQDVFILFFFFFLSGLYGYFGWSIGWHFTCSALRDQIEFWGSPSNKKMLANGVFLDHFSSVSQYKTQYTVTHLLNENQ